MLLIYHQHSQSRKSNLCYNYSDHAGLNVLCQYATLRYIDILSNFPYLPPTDDVSPRFLRVIREESASMADSYEDVIGKSSEYSLATTLVCICSII